MGVLRTKENPIVLEVNMKIFLLYDDDKEKDDLKKIILNNDLGILAGSPII